MIRNRKNKGKHSKGVKAYKHKSNKNDKQKNKINEIKKEEWLKDIGDFAPEKDNDISNDISLEEMLEVVRREIHPERKRIKHNKKKNRKKKTKVKKTIITIIQIILIGVLIYSGYQIYMWYRDNQENNLIKEELTEAITENNETITDDGSLDAKNYDIDFNKLKQTNNDVVGWLKVNNTNIEYPVVYTSNNEYYLNHSLNRNINSAGWPFIDYREELAGTDKNLIIYGHNRKDASMFGTLQDTLKPEWYENKANKNVIYITPEEKNNYAVFSAYRIAVEDYYITTKFKERRIWKLCSKTKRKKCI